MSPRLRGRARARVPRRQPAVARPHAGDPEGAGRDARPAVRRCRGRDRPRAAADRARGARGDRRDAPTTCCRTTAPPRTRPCSTSTSTSSRSYDDGSGLGIDWKAGAARPTAPSSRARSRRSCERRRGWRSRCRRSRSRAAGCLMTALPRAGGGRPARAARQGAADRGGRPRSEHAAAHRDAARRDPRDQAVRPQLRPQRSSATTRRTRRSAGPAAVWFVGAADPVAFKPLQWCFPIVGCFAGLGWFDEDDGVRAQAGARGRRATTRSSARPSAYSTGGWFPDPVLSTMLGGGDDALPELANVILHESVHATVLVPDEPFFNESFASYIADALTDHWIARAVRPRLARGSGVDARPGDPAAAHRAAARGLRPAQEALRRRASRATRSSPQKAKIIDELVADLHLRRRPNNASLTETRVYNGGVAAAARRAPRVRRCAQPGDRRQDPDPRRLLEDPAGRPRSDRQAPGARCKKSAPAAPQPPRPIRGRIPERALG